MVKGFNTNSTLDNIKLGMCMFKCNETDTIETEKVGKSKDYETPIPIISFQKIISNNKQYGLVEVEKQFGGLLGFLSTTQFLVFMYYDYYYPKRLSVISPKFL